MAAKRTGAAYDRSCPLCGDDEPTDIAAHIRGDCPDAVNYRRSVGLPDGGYADMEGGS